MQKIRGVCQTAVFFKNEGVSKLNKENTFCHFLKQQSRFEAYNYGIEP